MVGILERWIEMAKTGLDTFGRIVYDCLDENLITWNEKRVNPMCTGRFNMAIVIKTEDLRQEIRAIEGSNEYANGDRILGSVSRSALDVYLNMPKKTFTDRMNKRQLLSYIMEADKHNVDPITGENLGTSGPTRQKIEEWKAMILKKPFERKRAFTLTESDAKIMRSALIMWESRSENGTKKRVNRLLRRLDRF